MNREQIIEAIDRERDRQNKKFGWHRRNDNHTRYLILSEEVGEVSKAILQGRPFLDEVLQVAAVAVAWLEGDL